MTPLIHASIKAALVLLFVLGVDADTIVVGPNQAYTSIQDAIDAAQNGWTIQVLAGKEKE